MSSLAFIVGAALLAAGYTSSLGGMVAAVILSATYGLLERADHSVKPNRSKRDAPMLWRARVFRNPTGGPHAPPTTR